MQLAAALGIIALIVFIVFLGPWLVLVGINFIIDPFNIQVPYTLGTWFGAFLLMVTMKGATIKK